MGVRYWEDGAVNGVEEDNHTPQMPMRDGEAWRLKIELATGKIEGWPCGVTASTHYKVCDAGIYSALAADGSVVAKIDGYVPKMLCPKGGGYGDYAIMDIGADGVIDGWKADLSCFKESDD